MNTVVFILSGGSGIRLRPLSTEEKPKQFLPIGINGKSFFRMTVDRALKLTDAEHIYVLTHEMYIDFVKEHAPFISDENIIAEPCRRNTAPAIAAAAMKIKKAYGNPVITVLPADHFIKNEEQFMLSVTDAVRNAQNNNSVVMLGLSPTRPDTSFGYIKCGKKTADNVYSTTAFFEKPDSIRAMEFIEDGQYFWNSGIFAVKAETVLGQFKKHLPEVYSLAEKIAESADRHESDSIYNKMPNVSVDYGILEKTEDILMVRGDFGWDDIGSWEALDRLGMDAKIRNSEV